MQNPLENDPESQFHQMLKTARPLGWFFIVLATFWILSEIGTLFDPKSVVFVTGVPTHAFLPKLIFCLFPLPHLIVGIMLVSARRESLRRYFCLTFARMQQHREFVDNLASRLRLK